MNTPVNFELAKSLKEKGFDLPCRFLYKSEEEGWEEGIGVDYNWNSFESCSAPTIAEVIMWLYEKYGIWIEVYMDNDATFGYLISEITNKGRADTPLKRGFNSPTEAYEKGIEYTLQNRL